MDLKVVNKSKGCRRCRGGIVARLGTLPLEVFMLHRRALSDGLAGNGGLRFQSLARRSTRGVRPPGASVSGCRKPKAWRTSTTLSDWRNSIAIL